MVYASLVRKNIIYFSDTVSAVLSSNYWLYFYKENENTTYALDLSIYEAKDIQELLHILAIKKVEIKIDKKMKKEGYYAPQVQKEKSGRERTVPPQRTESKRETENEDIISHNNVTKEERTPRRRIVENEEEFKPHRQIELDDIPEPRSKCKRKLEL